MSNYKTHAERELKLIGYNLDNLDDQEEDPDKWILQNLFELLEVFERQEHSGASAPYCADIFKKLALFELLSPLTGADDEWDEIGPGVFQNNRASHVFKQADLFNGQAFDINGRIFRKPNGCCYTNGNSFVPITFPYTPTSEYVDVD